MTKSYWHLKKWQFMFKMMEILRVRKEMGRIKLNEANNNNQHTEESTLQDFMTYKRFRKISIASAGRKVCVCIHTHTL